MNLHSEMGIMRKNPMQRTVTAHLSVLMTVHNFSIHYNTEQFWQSPRLPPDNHHSLDVVYWRRGAVYLELHLLPYSAVIMQLDLAGIKKSLGQV